MQTPNTLLQPHPTAFGRAISNPKNHKHLLVLIALLIIVITFGSRLWLLQTRAFDNDEFEHMHSAWLISKGFLPYKDYFEHHTPAMHFLLAAFIPLFQPETEFSEAKELLLFSRQIMWVLSGIILVLTFKLGQLWRNWKTGLLGVVFLIFTVMFQEKTLEIRPDLLSVPCWLGCLILLMKMMNGGETKEYRKKWLIAGSGFLLGTSIMATQKMLFAMPGFTLAMLVYWFNPNSAGSISSRFTQILCQLAGFFTPILMTIGYFGLYGSAYTFVEYNLLLNLGWHAGFSPFEYIVQLLSQNPFLVGLGLGGLGLSIFQFRKSRKPGYQHDYILIINLVGLIAGLFIIPVPWRQYYLMFLPLLALFATDALIEAVEFMIQLMKNKKVGRLAATGILYVLFTAGMLLWTLPKPGDIEWTDIVKKLVLFMAVLIGLIPIALQKRDLALAFLLVALHLPTVKKFASKFNSSNAEQLANIQYVIENSSPNDTFMDGWQGVGLFRPHAYFYWMLHGEIRSMISEEQKGELLNELQSGKIKPKLVNLDNDLRDLSPAITSFILENYQPAGVENIHIRKSND